MENFDNELVAKYMFPMIGFTSQMMGLELPKASDSDQFTIPTSSLPRDDSGDQLICSVCNKISMAELHSEVGYQHYNDVRELFTSAKECALCNLIHIQLCSAVRFHIQREEAITDEMEAIELFASFIASQGLSMVQPIPVILKIDKSEVLATDTLVAIGTRLWSLERRQFALGWYWGRLLLHDDQKDSKRPLRPRGSEAEVLDRLAAWLNERKIELPAWESWDKPLPSRLLDLGDVQNHTSFPEADICLVETDRKKGQYIALSYCWGGFKDFRTLKENYQDRLHNIEFRLLPKVFAEAVKITRALGIRYLWIDALCIIQEDSDDWIQEAACMSHIYWNTTCRLAVTESKDPTESFFPPKEIVASVRVPSLRKEKQSHDPTSVMAQSMPSPTKGPDRLMKEMCSTQQRTENVLGPFEKFGEEGGSSRRSMASHVRHQAIDSRLIDDEAEASAENISGSSPDMNDFGSFVNDFMKRMQDNLPKEDINSSYAREEDSNPVEMYLTIIKSYTHDVDRGHLNTRAWVLQERLLAPRTIHFTKDLIYCEDQDDLCGEDWVRRYLTWLSCIHKVSEFSRIDLFPEKNFVSQALDSPEGLKSLFLQRSLYHKTESQHVPDPWLWISRKFSRCHLSYETDKLAALAGLVEKKRLDSANNSNNGRNFLGIWEHTLHIELAWMAPKHSKVNFIHDLKLPSWAWISYRGPIDFVKERRNDRRHDPSIVWTPPVAEFQLLEADTPDMSTPLPLKTPASLTISATVQKVHSISHHINNYGTEANSREDLAASSPFHFNQSTDTSPIPLATLSDCHETFDQNGKLIGFVSFDEDIPVEGDLFYVHISTLMDFREPILAHALVLSRLESQENCYRRVGLAELNYDWMTQGVRTTIKLL